MSLAIERRTSPRTPPGALGANILIMHEAGKWMIPGKLLNISVGGALIRSAREIVDRSRLRILVHDVPELGWIDAEIVHSARPSEAGVRFVTPFKLDFILAATEGKPGRGERAACKTPYLGDVIPIW